MDADETFALDLVRLARACGKDPMLARFYPDRRAWVLSEGAWGADDRRWTWPDLVPPNLWTPAGREEAKTPAFREKMREAIRRAIADSNATCGVER